MRHVGTHSKSFSLAQQTKRELTKVSSIKAQISYKFIYLRCWSGGLGMLNLSSSDIYASRDK